MISRRGGWCSKAVRWLVAVALLGWPVEALAYRPFDSTDAAVAGMGIAEIELGPVNWRHNDEGGQWIVPALTINYGFAGNWEAVIEGNNAVFAKGGVELGDVEAALKTILRDGSLQGKVGVSVASEFSMLLPGIDADNGAGLEWTMLVSDQRDWGAWHMNLGPMLARNGSAGWIAGLILEGPHEWPARPVMEVRYEKAGREEMIAELVGVIIPVRDGLAFDIGLRHAREGGRPDEQLRAGVTFDLH